MALTIVLNPGARKTISAAAFADFQLAAPFLYESDVRRLLVPLLKLLRQQYHNRIFSVMEHHLHRRLL